MIVIVDYGMGNLRSVLKCFDRLGVGALVSGNVADIEKTEKLVLPGVGHFGRAMLNLKNQGLIGPLREKVLGGRTPILGICLGMQLFARYSEEGDVEGLGWIDAEVVRLDVNRMDTPRKIPHMGWNTLNVKADCPLLMDVAEKDSFYFVHSYFIECNNGDHVAATSDYGYEFTSAIQVGNMYGTQFHPEKSHSKGMMILRKFADLKGESAESHV